MNHYVIEEIVYDKTNTELTKRFVIPVAQNLEEALLAGQELERKFLDVERSIWGDTVVSMSHTYIYVETDMTTHITKSMKPVRETTAKRTTRN